MCVADRRPVLGKLVDGHQPRIEPTELGCEVTRCWHAIPEHYPEVELFSFQLMPDHIHGLLFVKRSMEAHLGHIIKGFKIGCTRAKWQLSSNPSATSDSSAARGPSAVNYNSPDKTPLFEPGYQDSVLMGHDQLEHMLRYIKDNPRRLAIKRNNPNLFKVVSKINVKGIQLEAIGNFALLDHPMKMQVRCHNNTSPDNLKLIARQKEYFLSRGAKGGVVVSPCISQGEKEIARAALEAGHRLIVILENGFPPLYKPPGRYFDACANGKLLMLSPGPYHTEARKITRAQCDTLNIIARTISDEPWTAEHEKQLIK